MIPRRCLALPLVLLLLTAGCGPEKVSAPRPSDARYAEATEVGFGCGGGVAGAYDGRKLLRDGTVEVWSSGDGRTGTLGGMWEIPAADAERYFVALRNAGFFALEQGAPANMGCSLWLSGPTFRHEVYWSDEEGRPLPASLRVVVDGLRALKAPTSR